MLVTAMLIDKKLTGPTHPSQRSRGQPSPRQCRARPTEVIFRHPGYRQDDEATVLANTQAVSTNYRESSVQPSAATAGFVHVVEGAPGLGEESWGTTSVDYEKRTLTPRCVKDTPYSFQYRAGTENKLLMYKQRGWVPMPQS